MSMSTKHYTKIAAMVASYEAGVVGAEKLANDLADLMAEDNARFDRERFIAACGPWANPGPALPAGVYLVPLLDASYNVMDEDTHDTLGMVYRTLGGWWTAVLNMGKGSERVGKGDTAAEAVAAVMLGWSA